MDKPLGLTLGKARSKTGGPIVKVRKEALSLNVDFFFSFLNFAHSLTHARIYLIVLSFMS